ncbi:hypothetical protein DWQ65_04500 [Treponema phagedenis]|uniref:Uncharacterized protein n=1 Tax=Treponema phagedenis TaxID=162 RepID=A0AAE6ITX5_TREPH|nr:hypothetical protein FUT79_07660 [Treponema phagedenis]QEJ98240.1 hypothetical protein FUT82_09685 [Treponema phagedenis]QEK01013.1 hypothetical protein FUT84_07505 [Treponema phagedenis]QEK03750.1 hypothetical protein FUT83_07995 [Treponema phagedenis]QEK06021.1 hypothetical protein FUT80_04400 [Treponema phagedenis]
MFCLTPYCKQAKLVGEPKVAIPRVRPCAVSSFFLLQEALKLARHNFATDGKARKTYFGI